jgi:hypothetical protein
MFRKIKAVLKVVYSSPGLEYEVPNPKQVTLQDALPFALRSTKITHSSQSRLDQLVEDINELVKSRFGESQQRNIYYLGNG